MTKTFIDAESALIDPPETALKGKTPVAHPEIDPRDEDDLDPIPTERKPATEPEKAPETPTVSLKKRARPAAKNKSTPAAQKADKPVKPTAPQKPAAKPSPAKSNGTAKLAKPVKPAKAPKTPAAEKTTDEGASEIAPTMTQADITAMLVSKNDDTKDLGAKLAAARLANERSGEAARIASVPSGSKDNPHPWVADEGRSAGLKPIPPKGTPPDLKKKHPNAKEEPENPTTPAIGKASGGAAASSDHASNGSTEKAKPSAKKHPDNPHGKPPEKPKAAGKNHTTSGEKVPQTVPAANAKGKTGTNTGKARGKENLNNARPMPGLMTSIIEAADKGVTEENAASDPVTDSDTPGEASDKTHRTAAHAPSAKTRDTESEGVPTGLVADLPKKRLTPAQMKKLAERARPPLFEDEFESDREAEAVRGLSEGIWERESRAARNVTFFEDDDPDELHPPVRPYRLPDEEGAGSSRPLTDPDIYLSDEPRPDTRIYDTAPPESPFSIERLKAGLEDFEREHKRMPMPQPDWSSDRDPTDIKAEYAMRMHAWEESILKTDARTGDDRPDRGDLPLPRETLMTGTTSTIGGFPTPIPVREWTGPGSEGRTEPARGLRHFLSGFAFFSDILSPRGDSGLRLALTALFLTGVAATAAWLTCRLTVPGIVANTTPVAIAAVVNEADVRELMILSNLLDEKGIVSGRRQHELRSLYLPESALDSEGKPKPGLLTDLHFRAAVAQLSDALGAPIINTSAVLAVPSPSADRNTGATQTLDVTDEVKTLLGLGNLESAAARELLAAWIKKETRAETAGGLAGTVPNGTDPLGALTGRRSFNGEAR